MRCHRFVLSLACVAAPAALAQVAILDGNFDTLATSTAPNLGVPAGAWGFWDSDLSTHEASSVQMAIVPTSSFDPGATGNSLRLLSVNQPSFNPHVSNMLLSPYHEGDPFPLVANFDLWVPSGTAGGSVYLGRGFHFATDRAAQLTWLADGTLNFHDGISNLTIVSGYARDAWQSVRLEVDLVTDTFDVYYGTRNGPLILVGKHLTFRSGPQSVITRFTFAGFGNFTPTATAYLDNVVVTPGPGAVLVLGGLAMVRRPRGKVRVREGPHAV